MKNMNRTPVHVIRWGDKEESIYRIGDKGYEVLIRQVEHYEQNGIMYINEKIVAIHTDKTNLKRNTVLPGNIRRAYTIENIGEHNLLIRNGNPIETIDNNIIYTYLYYDSSITFLPIGNIDEDLEQFRLQVT